MYTDRTMAMTDEARDPDLAEAVRWLHQVDGRLMRRRKDSPGPGGWVAIVKTPSATGEPSQLILGCGDSLLEAVETARESWQQLWSERTVH